jgi:lipoprotein-releasing system ATP-binding protein
MMDSANIFDIERLFCSYRDNKRNKPIEVLEIEDISIAKGEITVILGPSGCGKSTFMEAISLMSDTIDDKKSRNVLFFSTSENKAIDLSKKDGDAKLLQKRRFQNFCFIFQDTNIMENFNPIENVALPMMVDEEQEGKAKRDAEIVLKNRLSLNIDLKKKGSSYSGGQKQRFAFARAFLAKGDILFGDEPTGNLDKYNSEKLFNVINYYVRTTAEGKRDFCNKIGAIIVTHSIELALQFADRIIVIVKPERINIHSDEPLGMGYSNPFFVYRNSGKNAWRVESSGLSGIHVADLDDVGCLPPIDDDGSTRFTYIRENDGNNSHLVKDRLKREIIFYLNNSYTCPQKVLVEIARNLNDRLKENGNKTDDREKLSAQFNLIKSATLDIIDIKSKERTKIEDFEDNFLRELKERFSDNDEISGLLPDNV